jgi:hypothetical protein
MTGLHTTMLFAGFVALAGAAMGPLLRPTRVPVGEGAPDRPSIQRDGFAAVPRHVAEPVPAGERPHLDVTSPTGAE